MARRSAKLAWPVPVLSGGEPTGAITTWSSSNRSIAARATARCPLWGGSKVPPKKAMRIAASYPEAYLMFTATIALGSNLGDRREILVDASERIRRLGRIVAQSSVYETEPVGYHDQPPFLNAVLVLETKLEPVTLLEELLAIEREM